MPEDKLTRYEYALLTRRANTSLSSCWPTEHDQPAAPKQRQRHKKKGPSKQKHKRRRLGINQRARLHGWSRWKKPFLSHFSTMHQRVSEAAGMDFGRGVQGPFGKIVGDRMLEKE